MQTICRVLCVWRGSITFVLYIYIGARADRKMVRGNSGVLRKSAREQHDTRARLMWAQGSMTGAPLADGLSGRPRERSDSSKVEGPLTDWSVLKGCSGRSKQVMRRTRFYKIPSRFSVFHMDPFCATRFRKSTLPCTTCYSGDMAAFFYCRHYSHRSQRDSRCGDAIASKFGLFTFVAGATCGIHTIR